MAGDEMTKNGKISNTKSCDEIDDPFYRPGTCQNNAKNQNQHKKGLLFPFLSVIFLFGLLFEIFLYFYMKVL